MQSDVNRFSGRLGVVASDAQEWIKRRGRVGIQQRVAQPRLAGFANGQALPVVSGVTETHFPVPSLEIIAKFSHLTLQPDVEQLVPVSELFTSWTGVVNAAKPNSRSHGSWDSVNDQSRIPDREGIKRILDWHTDAVWTKERVRAWRFEWIRRKRHRRCRRIEKRARILKVGKHHQVFVAQVAREGTVIRLAISRRQRRRECREVKEEVIATPLIISAGLWNELECIGADNTGGAWICIGSNHKRINIKWRS